MGGGIGHWDGCNSIARIETKKGNFEAAIQFPMEDKCTLSPAIEVAADGAQYPPGTPFFDVSERLLLLI